MFVACCRAAGIPARYVSGYFYTGETGEVASHAWVDVWIGGDDGWLSLDVTHGKRPARRIAGSPSAATISTRRRCAACAAAAAASN